MTTLLREPMAARKNKTASARIDAEILRRANIVAAFRDISVPDYLNALLGPLIDRDYQDEIQKESKRTGQGRVKP
jgi:hypothetical protein